jgi:hypothetical protein
MLWKLPGTLRAVNSAQRFPVTAPKAGTRKSKVGKGKGKLACYLACCLFMTLVQPGHLQHFDMSEFPGQGCNLFTQSFFQSNTASWQAAQVL